MSYQFESITLLTQKAYGGARCHQIEIIEANGTSVMPDHRISFWAEDLDTESDWKMLKATRETINFSENIEIIDGAQYYKSQMKISFKRDNNEMINKLRRYARKGAMIRWKDNNGLIKLMGTSDNPVRFTWGRDNKSARNQANQIDGLFTVISRMPVLSYPVAAD